MKEGTACNKRNGSRESELVSALFGSLRIVDTIYLLSILQGVYSCFLLYSTLVSRTLSDFIFGSPIRVFTNSKKR
jgi:hypothetical protein